MKPRAPRVMFVNAGEEPDSDLGPVLSGLGWEAHFVPCAGLVNSVLRIDPDVVVARGSACETVAADLCESWDGRRFPLLLIDGGSDEPSIPIRPSGWQIRIHLSEPALPGEVTALIRALTVVKRLEDEFARRERLLRQRAVRDELTGVYTRAYAFERAKQEVARAKRYGYPVSCLRLDIDHMTMVNERHGRITGDIVLREVAGLLVRMTRESDIVCRYRGDRFMVLLPQTDHNGLAVLADRVRLAVGRHPFEGSDDLRVTVTVGGATFPGPEVSGSGSLIRRAGDALRLAREGGRTNRVTVL